MLACRISREALLARKFSCKFHERNFHERNFPMLFRVHWQCIILLLFCFVPIIFELKKRTCNIKRHHRTQEKQALHCRHSSWNMHQQIKFKYRERVGERNESQAKAYKRINNGQTLAPPSFIQSSGFWRWKTHRKTSKKIPTKEGRRAFGSSLKLALRSTLFKTWSSNLIKFELTVIKVVEKSSTSPSAINYWNILH